MVVNLEVPAHLSHSQSSNLSGEYCSAQYFFERLLGKPAIPGWAAIGGSALHSSSEDWDHETLQGFVTLDAPELAALFNARFDEEIAKVEEHTPYPREEWQRSGRQGVNSTMSGGPNKKDEAWWRQWGPVMLASYAAWRLNSPWEIAQIGDGWAIEVPLDVTLGDVPVRGYIDRVFHQVIDGEDVYLVVDLKSGREPDGTAQLGTYRAGLMRQYDIDPRYGCYWLGGTGGSTSFVDLRQRWPIERVERRFATARRRQLAGEFDAKPSNLCGSCGVREFCAEFGGSKAAETPQPWEVGSVTVAQPAA